MSDYPTSVRSEIAFLNNEWRDRNEIPHIYSRETRLANTSRLEVTIDNARPRHEAGELDLDGPGFVLERHASEITDFHSKSIVTEQYFPEMKELILQLTGADDAFPVQFYQVRSRHPAHFFDAYSLYMHCDFSPNSWPKLAQRMIRAAGDERTFDADAWDFSLYNLWRPVGGEVQKDPLVLIDAATVERSDIVDYSAVKDSDTALAALPLFNENQQFYYVPYMQVDEVLIFKQMDSRPERALVCPHTSFNDPTAAPDANERESIDIRMTCVFRK